MGWSIRGYLKLVTVTVFDCKISHHEGKGGFPAELIPRLFPLIHEWIVLVEERLVAWLLRDMGKVVPRLLQEAERMPP